LKNARVLRISVTDRCDLRCIYCMPEKGVTLLPNHDLLTYEEIEAIVRAALDTGIRRFRITGGEPLVRKGLGRLVEKIAGMNPDDLAMTTNGLHLEEFASDLKAAGLGRVTVSLDTLRKERFEMITRRSGLDRIFAGIEKARKSGLEPIKVNTVVIRGVNDDEVPDFVQFAEREKLEVRFIELMPTSGLSPECKELGSWRPSLFVSGEDVRRRIEDVFGPLTALQNEGGVARTFLSGRGIRLGFISPVSDPFCDGCRRLRLTADGRLRHCLFDSEGVDMRTPLRDKGARSEEIAGLFRAALERKVTWERGNLEFLSSDMFKVGG
jgi:cyclic pyranopterin phosphate synthase